MRPLELTVSALQAHAMSSHFGSRAAISFESVIVVRCGSQGFSVFFFPRSGMPRGWHQCPSGWWQRSLRGPRPLSESWPRAGQQPMRQSGQGNTAAHTPSKIRSLETAHAVLAKARESTLELPVDVQISKCKEFIQREARREIGGRACGEVASLEQGRARLVRLEQSAAEASATQVEVNMAQDDTEGELARLRARVAELQGSIVTERPRVRQRVG